VKRRDFFADATVVATGSSGPIRVVLDRLRRVGLGERIINTTLAAMIAWALASLIPNNDSPILAPMTAIFTVQATLAESVSGAVQRILGVLLGIIFAAVTSQVVGLNALSIGIVVLVSLTAGIRLGLESPGAQQMAVSSLLVLLGGAPRAANNYAALYLADTLIGTAVALTMNSFIAPPSYLPNALLAFLALGEEVAAILDRLARCLDEGATVDEASACLESARAAALALEASQIALDRAEESLQFNVLAARHRPTVNLYARANRALEHAAIQTRIIARTVTDIATISPSWIAPEQFGHPLGSLLSATATALSDFIRLPGDTHDQSAFTTAIATAKTNQLDLTNAAAMRPANTAPAEWNLLGGILTVAGQFATDLESAAADLATTT
jgi:uncharacterized membrane protein YgaE (UPF0421/DUF939 family)